MKKMLLILFAISCITASAFAKEPEILSTVQGSKISVEGTIQLPYATSAIIYLIKPTYSIDNVTATNFNTIVQSLKQVDITDGKFSTEFTLNSTAISGNYNVYVSAYGMATPLNVMVYYLSAMEQDEFISSVNKGTVAELEVLFNASNAHVSRAMGLQIDEFLLIPSTTKMEIIGKIENETFTKDIFIQYFNELTIAGAIENAPATKIDDLLTKYQKEIELGTVIENTIATSKTSGVWGNALNVLSNEKFSTYIEIKKYISSSILVGKINSSIDYMQIDDILKDYKGTFGISETSPYWSFNSDTKKNVNLALFNKSFTKFSDFITAFNNAVGENTSITTPTKQGISNSGNSRPTVKISINNEQITPQTPPIDEKEYFVDVKSVPWAKEAIAYMAKRGIILGDGNWNFSPNDSVTREQFTKMLVVATNLVVDNATCDFNDVPQNTWFYKYVASGVNAGIIEGIGNNLFGSGLEITRQDVAVIANRVLKIFKVKNDKIEKLSFVDKEEFADYAIESIETLTQLGILNGIEDGSFMPHAVCTRAQAAKIVYGIIQKLQ